MIEKNLEPAETGDADRKESETPILGLEVLQHGREKKVPIDIHALIVEEFGVAKESGPSETSYPILPADPETDPASDAMGSQEDFPEAVIVSPPRTHEHDAPHVGDEIEKRELSGNTGWNAGELSPPQEAPLAPHPRNARFTDVLDDIADAAERRPALSLDAVRGLAPVPERTGTTTEPIEPEVEHFEPVPPLNIAAQVIPEKEPPVATTPGTDLITTVSLRREEPVVSFQSNEREPIGARAMVADDDVFRRNREQLFHPPEEPENHALRIAAWSVTGALLLILLYFAYSSGVFNGVLPEKLQYKSVPLEQKMDEKQYKAK